MMYPRLLVSRQLLQDDGVIFVSIDDHEVPNLLLLMNEVFGEENFVAQIVVQINPRGRHLDQFIAKTHEYVVMYVRDSEASAINGLKKDARMIADYNKQDQRGKYRELELRNRNPSFNSRTRPKLYYPIYVDPVSKSVALEPDQHHSIQVFPKNSADAESCWTWGKDKFQSQKDLLVPRQTREGSWRIFRKDYLVNEDGQLATTLPKTIWLDREMNNDYGKKAVQELFEGRTLFDFPKPPKLIATLIQMGSQDGDIVLDFFAGSCTTAQALLELNRQEDATRRFICVQFPELTPIDSLARIAGYDTIAELGRDRIRRVVKRLLGDKTQPALLTNTVPEDLGFKTYKLTPSEVRPWRDYTGSELSTLEGLFSEAETPLVEGWIPQDVLTEVMLLQGFPLDSRIERNGSLQANNIMHVTSESVAHKLYVCLDDRISYETVRHLHLDRIDVFVCLDSALTDESKMRLADVCNLQTI